MSMVMGGGGLRSLRFPRSYAKVMIIFLILL